MFTAREFDDITKAKEHIKKLLAEIDNPKSLEFELVHSLSEVECIEDGGSWEDISELLLDFLADLDAMQGFVIYDDFDGERWDYLEWEEIYPDDHYNIYKPDDPDQVYVEANEGLVVLYNDFAVCENEFPVVVVKKSLWEQKNRDVLDILARVDPGEDYTAKISPAIYVELFEQDA